MPAPDAITPDKPAKPIGTLRAPSLFDVRTDADCAANAHLICRSIRPCDRDMAAPAADLGARHTAKICQAGHRCSRGAVALGASTAWLQRLATIARGADTWRPDLAPPAAGHLAIFPRSSRTFPCDTEQLEARMAIYGASLRWALGASTETQDWPRRTAAQ